MFYIDSQKTLSRRESSLILPRFYRRNEETEVETFFTTQGQSTVHLTSIFDANVRSNGSIRKEIITSLFESMLTNIVESWEVINPRKVKEVNTELSKTPSKLINFIKKKKSAVAKQSKTRSRTKVELIESTPAAPDEKVFIRFRNGNTYEGNISMKCMHGEGRYQWSDGTVFLGHFVNNEIVGKGMIQWKDDTWYEGEFAGNLRHGKGLYVDSRKQCCYSGGWNYGAKHGKGIIYYTGSFKNSYEGEWVHNVRNGFGSREYCEKSGYKGEWDYYIREGKGLMIWPNHDFYRGEWKNGLMSGYGVYIWDTYYNNSMSSPSLCSYHGHWEKGKRHGYGLLDLGFGLGSFYKGEFKNNKKSGVGRFVTNNGLIIRNKCLFIDDNLGSLMSEQQNEIPENKYGQSEESYAIDICDNSFELIYHVKRAIKNIDKQKEVRNNIINEYIFTNNRNRASHNIKAQPQKENSNFNFDGLVDFEVSSMRNALRCYETELKYIYYQYANICNKANVHFTPVLIRLYLWQLYFDCNIYKKGLTLVEIDKEFHDNPDWLSNKPHNPFEKINYWQFRHHLIIVARKLYAKRQLPHKPENMLGDAFRTFMKNDILPGAGRKRGKLAEGYANFVPMKALYELYRNLGEPCTIRNFLCATRESPHYFYKSQPKIVDVNYPNIGSNAFVFDDEMYYIIADPVENNKQEEKQDLKLFNLSNLSSKIIINFFSLMFPKIWETNRIISIDEPITFFEFFEVFIKCTEESIRLTEEENKKLSSSTNAEMQTLSNC